MPLFCWSKKAVAAAAGCFKVKAPAGGFDLQKKHKRLPRRSIKIYSSCRVIIYIFFKFIEKQKNNYKIKKNKKSHIGEGMGFFKVMEEIQQAKGLPMQL